MQRSRAASGPDNIPRFDGSRRHADRPDPRPLLGPLFPSPHEEAPMYNHELAKALGFNFKQADMYFPSAGDTPHLHIRTSAQSRITHNRDVFSVTFISYKESDDGAANRVTRKLYGNDFQGGWSDKLEDH